jgi:hypothetical protein
MYGNLLPAPAPAPADSDSLRCAEVQRPAPAAGLDEDFVGALGLIVVTGVRPADAVAEADADSEAGAAAVDDVDGLTLSEVDDVHAASASTKSALAAAPSTRSMASRRGR